MENKLESTNQTTENYPIGNAQTSKTTTSEYPRHFRKYHPLCQDYFDRVEAAGGSFNVGRSIGIEEFTIRNAHDELFRDLASYINDGSISSLVLYCGTSFEGLGVAAVGPDFTRTNVAAGSYDPVRSVNGSDIGITLTQGANMQCDNDFAIVNPTNLLSAEGYAVFGYTTKDTYQSLLADYFNLNASATFDLTNNYDSVQHNVNGSSAIGISAYGTKSYVAAGYYPTASGFVINIDSNPTVSSSGTIPWNWSNIGSGDNTFFRLGSYETSISTMQIAFGGFLTDFALSGEASFKTPLKKFVTALGVAGTGLDV